jgi:hypothetical protein
MCSIMLLTTSYFSISSRSFNLPDCPHTFKWRRSGSSYHVGFIVCSNICYELNKYFQCTTSFVKGPVATLDAAASSVPPRLRVFETLPLEATNLDRGGVSINLLDYLLVTALLLVTDGEEWVTLARPRGSSLSEGGSKSAPASMRQWRKIVYGEPLFPSLRSPKAVQDMEASEDNDVMDISPSSLASRPASMRQWRKIIYGEPLFPSLSQYNSEIDGLSRTSTPWDDTSQSSESINYPSTPGSASAPAHGYLDPSFYNLDVPPMSQYSFEYQSTPSLVQPLPRPASAHPQSSISSPIRALPKLPIIHPSSIASSSTSRPELHLHRCQSTPFLTNFVSTPSSQRPPATPITTKSQSTWRPDHYTGSPSSSSSGAKRIRLLPQPPHSTTIASPLSPSPHSAVTSSSCTTAHSPFTQRSLPPTPATSAAGPLLPVTSAGELGHERPMRRSLQKAVDEIADWPFTQQEQQDDHNQASRDAGFEAPPPPYNAIDFSHPPHVSAPPPPITSILVSASSLSSSSSLVSPPSALPVKR